MYELYCQARILVPLLYDESFFTMKLCQLAFNLHSNMCGERRWKEEGVRVGDREFMSFHFRVLTSTKARSTPITVHLLTSVFKQQQQFQCTVFPVIFYKSHTAVCHNWLMRRLYDWDTFLNQTAIQLQSKNKMKLQCVLPQQEMTGFRPFSVKYKFCIILYEREHTHTR